jgi:hypothetical protein
MKAQNLLIALVAGSMLTACGGDNDSAARRSSAKFVPAKLSASTLDMTGVTETNANNVNGDVDRKIEGEAKLFLETDSIAKSGVEVAETISHFAGQDDVWKVTDSNSLQIHCANMCDLVTVVVLDYAHFQKTGQYRSLVFGRSSEKRAQFIVNELEKSSVVFVDNGSGEGAKSHALLWEGLTEANTSAAVLAKYYEYQDQKAKAGK